MKDDPFGFSLQASRSSSELLFQPRRPVHQVRITVICAQSKEALKSRERGRVFSLNVALRREGKEEGEEWVEEEEEDKEEAEAEAAPGHRRVTVWHNLPASV